MNTMPTAQPSDFRTDEVELDDIIDALAGWRGDLGLRHLLRSALAGGGIVSVSGASGAGKSRLIMDYLSDPRYGVYLSAVQDREELERLRESVGAKWLGVYGCDDFAHGRPVRQLIQQVSERHLGVRQIVADPVALQFSPRAVAKWIPRLRTFCQRRGVALVLTTVPSVPIPNVDTEISISPDGDDWLGPQRTVTINHGGRRDVFQLMFDAEGRLVPAGGRP